MKNSSSDARRKPLFTVIIVAVCVILASAIIFGKAFFQKNPSETETYGRVLLGTIVEITLWEDRPEAAEAAFAEISRLEKIFSTYIPDSDVSGISAGAGGRGAAVSPEVIRVVDVATRVAALSGGAFDPTIGVLSNLWDFSGESDRVPDRNEIGPLLPLVDYRSVFVDREASVVGLRKKNSRLNLDGVAKGYIVGKAVDALKGRGVARAIIRAGGDMTFFKTDETQGAGEAGGEGREPDAPFIIGIQHPRKRDALLGRLRVAGGPAGTAVATSGDYERFFIKDGVRYHHILDPKTGYPAALCQSVTIVSRDPTLADALSTAVFVMGPEKGMELVKGLDGVEAVIVDSAGEITISPALEKDFERF